jgi:hypothetical protein
MISVIIPVHIVGLMSKYVIREINTTSLRIKNCYLHCIIITMPALRLLIDTVALLSVKVSPDPELDEPFCSLRLGPVGSICN